MIANTYSSSLTYSVGDCIMRTSSPNTFSLYRCIVPIETPEEWTASHWQMVTVTDELAKKYEKPSNGIPESDLSQSVQGKLNNAAPKNYVDNIISVSDTQPSASENKLWVNTDNGSGNSYEVPTVAEALALGVSSAAVGDLVRVATVDSNGKPTSWQKAPLCEIRTNPNLLDNWYFVGGGSQQGGGQFPINQRGQASYQNAGYCIDRWANSGAFYISQYWINFPANTSITQKLEPALKSSLNGKTITLSLVFAEYSQLIAGTAVYQSAPESAITVATFSDYFTILIDTSGDIELKSFNKYASCQAMKLELGSEQTLAHQENGQWVLNEIPDYGDELARCQRYFYRWNGNYFVPTFSNGECYGSIAHPVKMAGTPSITNVTYNTGWGAPDVPTVNEYQVVFHNATLSPIILSYDATILNLGG